MADSRSFVGATVLTMISDSWSLRQLSFEARSAPLASWSSRVGSASAPKGQRRADCTHNDVLRVRSEHNQAANDDVVACLHEAASGNIRQLGIDGSIEVVNFNQADTGGVTGSAHDCGVSGVVGWERGYDGRPQVVRG